MHWHQEPKHNKVNHTRAHMQLKQKTTVKLCPIGAQTCALPLFCDRDLEINIMTLKLEDNLDILKMYPHTENKATSSKYSHLDDPASK